MSKDEGRMKEKTKDEDRGSKERGFVAFREKTEFGKVCLRFRFEKIDAWQLARTFSQAVCAASKGFPQDEAFALTAQLRRTSI
jgi:hypothetical protein